MFRDCGYLRTQHCHATSSIGVDVFWELENAPDGVGPINRNENVHDIGCLPGSSAAKCFQQLYGSSWRRFRLLAIDSVAIVTQNAAEGRNRASEEGETVPPSVRRAGRFHVSDGITGRLTMECGGNVHDGQVANAMCGSWKSKLHVEWESDDLS
jgi:hypothetical protein